MYKHKLFARHPSQLLKSKGSLKTYTKKGHRASGKSNMDDYLLSLVKGVSNGMKLSKNEHTGGRARKKIGGSCCGSGLKFVR